MELVDTSVWIQQRNPALSCWFAALLEGRIAICDMIALEILTEESTAEQYATRHCSCLARVDPHG